MLRDGDREWGIVERVRLRLVLYAVALILALAPHLSAEVACGFTQLTDSAPAGRTTELVALSSDGRSALLVSNANLAGAGTFGLELYRVSVGNLAPPSLETLSPVSLDGIVASSLSASEDLSRVIFRSNRDFTGGNPDGSVELFLLELSTRRTFQLTNGTADHSVFSARLSGDGTVVAFISDADPLGQNGDGSREVFWLSLASASLRQLTSLSRVAVPHVLSISGDGGRVAYQVRQTLGGFTELHVADMASGRSQLILVTERLEASFLVRDGVRLLVATGTDLTGGNFDGSLEIFEIDLAPDSAEPFRQVTDFSVSDQTPFQPVGFSGDGRFVAVLSSLDLSGWPGRSAPNLFLLDVADGSFSQITHWTAPVQADPDVLLNVSGDRMLLTSRVNLITGSASGGREVFLAGCEPATVRYVPQVGNGLAGVLKFATSFVMSNTGANGSVRLDFFNRLGQPMDFPLEGLDTRSSYFFPLQSGRPLLLASGGQGRILSGYVRIASSPTVTGNAIFTGARQPSLILYEAAVPFSELLTDFSLVVNTYDNYLTGLALVNPAPVPAKGNESEALVTVRLYDERFDLLAEKEILLAVGQHQAQFVHTMFAEIAGIRSFVGTLTVHSSRPLSAVALRQHDDPRLDFPFEVPTLTTLTVAPGRADRDQ